ncbi:MAG: hypothetical protein ACOYJZ_09315 [Acutalibacter sp.]
MENLWREIRRFSKKKRPRKGPGCETLEKTGKLRPKPGSAEKSAKKTGFQPSGAASMTKDPLGSTENAGNPIFPPPYNDAIFTLEKTTKSG